jgi:hypothetical protein
LTNRTSLLSGRFSIEQPVNLANSTALARAPSSGFARLPRHRFVFPFLSLTPGPSPFSSTKITPAFSKSLADRGYGFR